MVSVPDSPASIGNTDPLRFPNGYTMQKDVDLSSNSSTDVQSESSSSKAVHMKKRLGLAGGTAMIVGTMIGNRIELFFFFFSVLHFFWCSLFFLFSLSVYPSSGLLSKQLLISCLFWLGIMAKLLSFLLRMHPRGSAKQLVPG